MNKKLLTAAVAATLAAPAAYADATWYGSIRTSFAITDAADDTSANVRDHSSRIGVKGAQDLGNGLKIPYRFELKMDSDESQGVESGRIGRIGLQGGFGQLHIGQQWGPYFFNIRHYADDYHAVGRNFWQGNFRVSNSIRYITPKMGGFQATALVSTDGPDGESGVDTLQLGAQYKTKTFGIGAATIIDRVNDDNDVFAIGAGYNFGTFRIGAIYEDDDKDNANVLRLQGTVVNGANIIRFGTEMLSADSGDADAFMLSFTHKLGKKSRVAVELEHVSPDNGDDTNEISFFIRTDF